MSGARLLVALVLVIGLCVACGGSQGSTREVAHRMVFMHEGSLIEEGPPAELVTGARDPRTRRFLEAVL
jgi:ABC-type polar amino acid transport system ATPase subunit